MKTQTESDTLSERAVRCPKVLTCKRHLFGIVALALLTSGGTVRADLTMSEQQALAQRFRPYIKTTREEGQDEPHHPCNWQWFVEHSTLVTNYVQQTDPGCAGLGIDDVWPDGDVALTSVDLANPSLLVEAPGADVRQSGALDFNYALHLDATADHAGEAWGDVISSSHGIYAHVEEVPGTTGKIVNIEYSILWAYNSALCNYHNGDITTITVVYDRGCDLLTRVTYVIHGKVIESFRIAKPQAVSLVDLDGLDPSDAQVSVQAAKLEIADTDGYQDGPSWHSPSDSRVYLARDPASLRYEHPVAYAEYGSHELWPNSTGSAVAAPDHDGDGVAFLPVGVQLLGTLSAPASEHIPFLFYNGKFGTDPMGIIFHGTWFWPDGRDGHSYGINADRFTDRIPYQQNGDLAWPPPDEYTSGPITVYVDARAGTPFDGSLASPFPDAMTANSFVPSGGTVSVASGTYAGRAILSRACTFVARGGVVTIGAP